MFIIHYIIAFQNNDSDPESEESEDEASGGDEEGEEGGGGDEEDQDEEDDDDEDEEDLEDPLEQLKETCGDLPSCSKLKMEFESCNERVNSRSRTEETCVQELFDFLECQDKCVSI